MPKIERALISVFDKTGLVSLAQILIGAGIEIISTGGTAKTLRTAGFKVTELSEYTGFPEMLDGRVKTLHPKIHGGLLFVRGNPEHEKAVREREINGIELVVVNLYPFERTVAQPNVTLHEAVENIDIGGPSMLRSAAKNHESVTVLVDPADYALVAEQIRSSGETTLELRRWLAAKTFARTAAYDGAITAHFSRLFRSPSSETDTPAGQLDFPEELTLSSVKAQTLRYGENPHQRAALYGRFHEYYRQVHGKEFSYNNILDLTAAEQLIAEFNHDAPTVLILKHTNPCGVGQASSLRDAWEKALATDRQAPFGGIIAVNQTLDLPCAEAIADIFSELIVAPDFTSEALERLKKKKNLRLVKALREPSVREGYDVRFVGAESYLLQERDLQPAADEPFKVVTKRAPSEAELTALRFGWRVTKHVKSNAIVFSAADRTLGIGAGQMSRIDSTRIAAWKAGAAGLSLKGSAVCSDAFFPFADGLIAAAESGATAVVQPGGSLRDAEVIAAADERNLAMVFTGIRHFKH